MTSATNRWVDLIRYANRRTRDLRSLRSFGIRAYATFVRANVFYPPPRVLLTGPAKSGTHLLSDCLALMPKMMYSGRHFSLREFMVDSSEEDAKVQLDTTSLKKFLDPVRNGMFVTAHARFRPEFRDLVRRLGFRHIVLLRDPRDVVVSAALSQLRRQPWHPAHRLYYEVLQNNDERIMALIVGTAAAPDVGRSGRSSIGSIYRAYLPWTEEPDTLVVRFEELVAPSGGGDEESQLTTIQRIGEFIGRPLSVDQAEAIARSMYAKSSITFRKGMIGDWKNRFTKEHRAAFSRVAGDVLMRLGYEDREWVEESARESS